ncbi:MAG: hypothetical protein AN487_16110 [Anabaena sp. CRKS33]|nr:MAG: hypothetical protein AN487_16110 [Anabaena sp. CRKS33]
MAYKNHLNTGLDLVTAYEKTRAGFVALAIERNRRATPFVVVINKFLQQFIKFPIFILHWEN